MPKARWIRPLHHWLLPATSAQSRSRMKKFTRGQFPARCAFSTMVVLMRLSTLAAVLPAFRKAIFLFRFRSSTPCLFKRTASFWLAVYSTITTARHDIPCCGWLDRLLFLEKRTARPARSISVFRLLVRRELNVARAVRPTITRWSLLLGVQLV